MAQESDLVLVLVLVLEVLALAREEQVLGQVQLGLDQEEWDQVVLVLAMDLEVGWNLKIHVTV